MLHWFATLGLCQLGETLEYFIHGESSRIQMTSAVFLVEIVAPETVTEYVTHISAQKGDI